MSKYFAFIFYIFSIAVTYSQNIIGIVKDSNGIAIENATVFVWNSDQKQKLLGYYYCNEIGNFEISLKINETVFIEITNINFQTFSKTVKSGDKISVILQKSDVILDEVIIKTEKAIQVKKDSTFYDPKKFLNGTEKKIEDLLKKLPGITVNEATGQIKFKGKKITTVKLENDDLFGSNYTIGTRHISVDMVEQVQAIENYSDNSLLKGIEDSDKVVLNLRIKKNKTDFSGDVTTESGFEKNIFSSNEATILGINKNIKMFGFISQANFGIDSNNLDLFFEEVEIGSKNFDFLAKKNISLYNGNQLLSPKRTAYNDYFNFNNNLIFNLSKRVKVKNNIYFFTDRFTFKDFSDTNFKNNVAISNTNNFVNKPNYFRTDLKLIFNISNKSLIENTFIFKIQTTNSFLESTQNQLINLNAQLNSKDVLFNSKTLFTTKISDRKALQFESFFSFNKIPQTFANAPANSFTGSSNLAASLQNTEFSKYTFKGTATYLTSSKGFKNSIFLNFQFESSPFVSNFVEDSIQVPNFTNVFDYRASNISLYHIGSVNYRKFKIKSYLSSQFIKQNVSNLISNDVIIPYAINCTYSNNKHSFSFSNETKYNTPTEDFFYINNVFTGLNLLRNNKISLNLIKSNQFKIAYKYDDLLKLFLIKFNIDYNTTRNTYIFNLNATPNIVTFTYFQNPASVSSKNVNFEVEKSIKSLHLSFNQVLNIAQNDYQNSIDNFAIRNNVENRFTAVTTLLSSFDFPLNFETKFNFTNSDFSTNNSSTLSRKSIDYIFRLNLKPSDNWIFSVTNEYLNSDLPSNNSVLSFFDCNIQYRSNLLRWLKFNILGKNLLNKSNFKIVSLNDFSINIYQSQLLARHILAGATINF